MQSACTGQIRISARASVFAREEKAGKCDQSCMHLCLYPCLPYLRRVKDAVWKKARNGAQGLLWSCRVQTVTHHLSAASPGRGRRRQPATANNGRRRADGRCAWNAQRSRRQAEANQRPSWRISRPAGAWWSSQVRSFWCAHGGCRRRARGSGC